MKKKTIVIIILAVVLICATLFAFPEVMKDWQERKPDSSAKAPEKAGQSDPQPSGDIEDGGTQAPDVNSSLDGGTVGYEKSIIAPGDAKKVIGETSDLVIRAIADKDFKTVAEYAHPELGVRFTPYTFVSVENDLIFSKNEIKDFLSDEKVYQWGYYDGLGDEIKLTPGEYYENFIYTAEYVNAPEIGYNEVLSFGNMMENQFEIYKGAVIIEYYYPGFEPQYEGLDWRSLRLVFQQYNGEWKLTGLINNQWTI